MTGGYPDILVCPATRSGLRAVALAEAEQRMGGSLRPRPVIGGHRPIGPTPTVMERGDGRGAYPVAGGVPMLMAPEMLSVDPAPPVDVLGDERYTEAFAEMGHYSSMAAAEAASVASTPAAQRLSVLAGLPATDRARFPAPAELWLDATYEMQAQWDAFRHLQPIAAARVLQVGGRGLQAVKMLLAGAAEAWLMTPMLGELRYGRALAEHAGVADRFHTLAGLAEEMPFADGCMDVVYSQGCVHHWVTSLALPECARVLAPGGRFAAVEPWRGPLYGAGVAVLGKRDPAVQCVVLTEDRVEPYHGDFATWEVIHHGVLTRYPLLALKRAGVKPRRRTIWGLGRFDDALASSVPRLRAKGSSVALLATVAAATQEDRLASSSDDSVSSGR